MGIIVDSEVKTPCTLLSGMWKNRTSGNLSLNSDKEEWISEKTMSFNKNASPPFDVIFSGLIIP